MLSHSGLDHFACSAGKWARVEPGSNPLFVIRLGSVLSSSYSTTHLSSSAFSLARTSVKSLVIQWPKCHLKIQWNPTGNSVKFHWKPVKINWKPVKINWKPVKINWKPVKINWKPVKLHWRTSATALKFPVAPGSLELAKRVLHHKANNLRGDHSSRKGVKTEKNDFWYNPSKLMSTYSFKYWPYTQKMTFSQ